MVNGTSGNTNLLKVETVRAAMGIGTGNPADRAVREQIFQCIADAQTVVLCRHVRPDGDAVGQPKALPRCCVPGFRTSACWSSTATAPTTLPLQAERMRPSRRMRTQTRWCCAGLCDDRPPVNPLALTGGTVVKIDHHPDVDPYGDISWVDPTFSSTCEMVTDFYRPLPTATLTAGAAEYLYLGMVTDSGRFRFREVTGDTLRRAAVLLDAGIDTERLYANLYWMMPPSCACGRMCTVICGSAKTAWRRCILALPRRNVSD